MSLLGHSSEELALAARVDAVARDELVPIAERFGEQHVVCRELVDTMAAHGFFGLNIGPDYGGTGTEDRYSTVLCIIREHLGYHSPLVDFTFGCQGLGTVAIVRKGSPEQRARYLPDLVAGRRLFAFAVTEPGAGSDVRGIQTTARRDGDTYVLNGLKTFISGAPEADVYVVLARTDGQQRGKGLTAFLVERGTGGFSGRQDIQLTAPHAIGSLVFDECEVPAGNVIGEVGHGLAVALGTLEIYRPSVGALAVGMGHRAYDLAAAHARQRHVLGSPLASLEAIRLKLARMWLDVWAARRLVYRAAATRDRGSDSTREAAMAKLFATEAAHRAIYESQQIHGGLGVRHGQEIEGLFRHIRQATIYEGTSEIQRSIIARAETARDAGDRPRLPARNVAASALARRSYEHVRAWAVAEPGLLSHQAVQIRLADAVTTVDVAELTQADADDPAAESWMAPAADVAATRAVVGVVSLARELHHRAGFMDAGSWRELAGELDEAAAWSEDCRLLDMADQLLGPVA